MKERAIDLITLSNQETYFLNEDEQNRILAGQTPGFWAWTWRGPGGDEDATCGCNCCWATDGGSSTENNGKANRDRNLFSPYCA